MSKKMKKSTPRSWRKKLLNDRTHGAAKVGAKELEKAGEFAEGYKSFMDAAKTEREAVTWAVQAAEEPALSPSTRPRSTRPATRSTTTTAARPCAWPSSARGRQGGRAHRRCPHRQPPH